MTTAFIEVLAGGTSRPLNGVTHFLGIGVETGNLAGIGAKYAGLFGEFEDFGGVRGNRPASALLPPSQGYGATSRGGKCVLDRMDRIVTAEGQGRA
jgi:hypothetical protein